MAESSPKCPEHEVQLISVEIVKYNNRESFGKNYFCPKEECNYEEDHKSLN